MGSMVCEGLAVIQTPGYQCLHGRLLMALKAVAPHALADLLRRHALPVSFCKRGATGTPVKLCMYVC